MVHSRMRTIKSHPQAVKVISPTEKIGLLVMKLRKNQNQIIIIIIKNLPLTNMNLVITNIPTIKVTNTTKNTSTRGRSDTQVR